VVERGGASRRRAGDLLDAETSGEIFARTGRVRRIEADVTRPREG
jgi:hypothetical protein